MREDILEIFNVPTTDFHLHGDNDLWVLETDVQTFVPPKNPTPTEQILDDTLTSRLRFGPLKVVR